MSHDPADQYSLPFRFVPVRYGKRNERKTRATDIGGIKTVRGNKKRNIMIERENTGKEE